MGEGEGGRGRERESGRVGEGEGGSEWEGVSGRERVGEGESGRGREGEGESGRGREGVERKREREREERESNLAYIHCTTIHSSTSYHLHPFVTTQVGLCIIWNAPIFPGYAISKYLQSGRG